MDIHNVISMVDTSTKKKTPLRLPDQVKKFQNAILDYNGSHYKKLDYENLKGIVCDAGSGGQMVGGISDYMLADWEGKDGKKHKGIIDKKHKANETAIKKYPDAIDIMELVDPKGHRNEIFAAAQEMMKLGVVTWPEDNEGRDYIVTINDDGTEDRYNLSPEEMISLAQIELMKDEIVSMCKYESNGSISYRYPSEIRNKKHDDRAFTFGLLCWFLAKLRRGQIVNQPKKEPKEFKMMYRAPKTKK